MRLYLAGNFILLNDVEKERKFKDKILAKGKEYHRLVSFYYPKNVATVLEIQKEIQCQKENLEK